MNAPPFPLVGELFPPVRSRIALLSVPRQLLDGQLLLLDLHPLLLQPGLMLLSGHFTLLGLCCLRAILALLAFLHNTMLHPQALTR